MARSKTDASGKQSALDFSYTQNREISWLQFDKRVLEESRDADVPLLERLKMAAIFESNLDEFFMIRVGSLSELASLKLQPVDNKSNQTPAEQVRDIYTAVPPLLEEHAASFAAIEKELAEHNVLRVAWDSYSFEDQQKVDSFYSETVSPIISPQVIDPRHPFPNLRNTTPYAVFNLRPNGSHEHTEDGVLGMIEIPPTLPRVLELESVSSEGANSYRYTLIEDVILACGVELFGSYTATERAVIRVTRNADIDPDEGCFDIEEDYRSHMKKILKQRLRLNPVRLEVQGSFSRSLVKSMRKALELSGAQVYRVATPLGMGGFAFSLEDLMPRSLADELTHPPFSPQPAASVLPGVPMWKQIREHDRLLFFPYESMEPFLRLIHESALDPDVMQIKITLYRVSKKSRLCESLITAAENGVDVTVLMELRARFDEENNIEWAERLEDAGCTVLYGAAGYKVHSKICQITRRSDGEVLRITQLGTGNYNEKTARLYADYSLMTCDPRIGEDANRFFRNLQIGNLEGEYKLLGVAPIGLKPLIMRGLNREIRKALNGEEAYCLFKMNSLTDREVIDKIADASCAGVRVDMIIRGISCLLPGIPGKTENVHIHSIVGRMLEHARVYAFGKDSDTMYLSSADMMTRNTEHRVEIAYPVLDPALRVRIHDDVALQLRDNVKGRILQPNGTYARIAVEAGGERIEAQETYMRHAVEAASRLEEQLMLAEKKARRPQRVPVKQESYEGTLEPADAAVAAAASPVAPAASDATAQTTVPVVEATTPEATAEETQLRQAAQDCQVTDPAQELTRELLGQIKGLQSQMQELQEQVKAVQAEPVSPVEVMATPLPKQGQDANADTAQQDVRTAALIKGDTAEQLERMVRRNGRSSTGWALIRAGLRVLFRGSIKKD